ncbi:MAG: MotA/TolQ/ExbB proton channel family protein [Gammaproteobacteria bacterium]|nr:MotA/TolQ/ExbB proton channel family protein [Gammaproteobacteria bacterium]
METYQTVVTFFQTGGLFMYPIVVVLALGIAIAAERYVFLSRSRATNRKLWTTLQPMLSKGDLKRAAALLADSKSAIGKILHYGMSRSTTGRRRDDINTAMEEGLMEIIPHLEKRTHYLATFANIATLLGLLGTIVGLIQAFTAVAGANPAEKADMLSASISVAMNTTAFGLIVSIPLLLIHAVLQTKTVEIVDSLEMASMKFLNMLTEQTEAAK